MIRPFVRFAVFAGAEGPFSAINRTANDAHTPIIGAPDTVRASEPFAVTITVTKDKET